MQPFDEGSPALALRSEEVTACDEDAVRSKFLALHRRRRRTRRFLVMLVDARMPSAARSGVLRHRLERCRTEGLWTFGVTSARDGEGKSTLAAQLASQS